MAPTKKRRRGHDRGQVLTDLAVAIADGATAITDLRVLADQPDLFGQVASVATAWRALEAIDAANKSCSCAATLIQHAVNRPTNSPSSDQSARQHCTRDPDQPPPYPTPAATKR